ncbi:MAG: chromate efflux transporter [Acidobacteriia bacterium]|nr:chromate efflux transporter [Terriglobia bacterium]
MTAPPTLGQLFLGFLRVGATAFGGPAMVVVIRRLAVERRRWLAGDAFDDGVALCQVIPGATAMQTAAYVGLRARGVAGAAAAFVAFGLPSFVVMLTLSAMYSRAHGLPVVVSAFSGLRAVIVGLMANAAVSFGGSSLRQWSHVAIATLAAALFGVGSNPILVILLAAVAGWALLRSPEPKPVGADVPLPLPSTTRTAAFVLGAAAMGLVALALADRQLAALVALMCRVDLFAFGGGFASVPLMHHEVVDVRHWLAGSTFLDGIALGQVTPGPIVITATFVGHQLGGLIGGALATVGVFLPSFLLVVAAAPYFDRLKRSPAFTRLVSGVLCSFVGLLLTVTVQLAHDVGWTWAHGLLGAAAFVALRLEVDVLWVVAGGTILSVVLCH